MKKIYSVFISICIVLSQFCVVPLVHAQSDGDIIRVAYSENFEKMTLNTYPKEDSDAEGYWETTGSNLSDVNLMVTANPNTNGNSSSKVLLLEKPLGKTGYQPGLTYFIGSNECTRTVKIGAKVYIPSTADRANVFNVVGAEDTRQIMLYMSNEGIKYAYTKNGDIAVSSTISGTNLTNQWFDFMVEADTVAKTADVYVNGSCVQEDIAYLYPDSDNLSVDRVFIRINNKDSTKYTCTYFDDFYIKCDYTDAVTSAIDTITDSDISSGLLSEVIVDLNELPTEVDDVTLEWKSDNHSALSDDGKITRRAFTQTANLTVTATSIDNYTLTDEQKASESASKSFEVTIPGRTDATDEEILREYVDTVFAIEKLTDSTEINNAGRNVIYENLNGITTDNTIDATFVWSTDKSEVLTESGMVTRPSSDAGDADVNLTLTAEKNGALYVKEYKLTVAKELTPEAKIAQAMERVTFRSLVNEQLDVVDEWCYIKKGLTLPSEGLHDVSITWSGGGSVIDTSDGSVYRGIQNEAVILTAEFEYDGESATKEYKFIIEMSPSSKIAIDKDAIDCPLWSSITEDFSLPSVGAVYDSDIIWSSDNNAIIITNGKAVVTRPEWESTDAKGTITATVTNEDVTEEFNFDFTVVKQPSDEQCVLEQAAALTWDKISWEEQDDVSSNLSFVKNLKNGVYVTWSITGSDTNVIANDGTVTNPGIGEESVTVTVKANICKGIYSTEKTWDVTVKAFESIESLLKRAATALTFETISADSIDSVINDLTMSKSWKYGTEIEWESSDPSLLLMEENDDSTVTGIINRPSMGEGEGIVILTAGISYGDEVVKKDFLIKIPEEDIERIVYSDDCEAMGAIPTASYGTWSATNTKKIDFCVVDTADYADIEGLCETGESNKAIMVYKDAGVESDVQTIPYLTYYVPKTDAMSGRVVAEMKVFITPDTARAFRIQLHSTSTAGQIQLYFDTDMIRAAFDDGELVELRNGDIYGGEWINVKIDASTTEKRYKLYVDGEEVTDSYTDYDEEWGVPFNYYHNPASPSSLLGFAFSLNTETAIKTQVFVDDILVTYYPEYSDGILELRDEFETRFLSENNINYITEDLILPDFETDYVSVSYSSSDESVIDKNGKVTSVSDEKNIVYTATITYGSESIKCSYVLKVKPDNYVPETDEECVHKDLLNAVNAIKEAYNLNNIKDDIVFCSVGANGSTITLTSSNDRIISSSGKVIRPASDTTVSITVTAEKNGYSESDSLTLVVKAKTVSQVITGSNGLSSIGTYGGNTSPSTGITVKDDEKSELSTSIFSDLSTQHWAYSYINELYGMEIINGDGGNFYPEVSIKREDFVKMLVLALNITPGGESKFSDVEESSWYAPYISAAADAGIVDGYGEKFGVGDLISRQDMAVMIVRALELGGNTNSSKFSDDNSISDYAKEAVYTAKSVGLIDGRDNNNFVPKAESTRAEAATLIYRMMKYAS